MRKNRQNFGGHRRGAVILSVFIIVSVSGLIRQTFDQTGIVAGEYTICVVYADSSKRTILALSEHL